MAAAASSPVAELGPAVAVERRAAEPVGTAVFGRATDARGEALLGWHVELLRRRDTAAFGSSFHTRGKLLPTDAEGGFAFEAIEPGSYQLQIEGSGAPPLAVDLAAGERRRADLQLADDRCAVVLALTRGGVPLLDRRIQLVFADGEEHFLTASEGEYQFPAPVGCHRLRVAGSGAGARTAPLREAGYFVAELPLVVPPACASLRRTVEVPAPALEVVASDGGNAPFPYLTFAVDGRPAFGGGIASWEFGAPDGRVGRLDELPPGEWTVTARSPYFAAKPQRLQIAQGGDVHHVVITGCRSAVVRLDLRDLGGQPYHLALRSGDSELACTDVAKALVPRAEGAVLGFANVPVGPATWPVADREVAGELQFLMFDAMPSPTLEVLAAGDNSLTLCVQPRAFVQLVACGSTGMETPQASVEVFLGSKKVAPMGVLRRSRWQGCLPPGEYRVVIREQGADAADAATREHRVFVQRQNLWLRLRP